MVNSADFTKRLELILDYYGLSATAFSEKIDFNRSTISHLLSGRNKPSLEFVLKVVETFPEVNIYWFLNGKGSFPPSETINQTSESSELRSVSNDNPVQIVADESKATSKSANSNAIDKNAIERIIIFYSDGSFKEYLP